jgi:hypothetical protein
MKALYDSKFVLDFEEQGRLSPASLAHLKLKLCCDLTDTWIGSAQHLPEGGVDHAEASPVTSNTVLTTCF